MAFLTLSLIDYFYGIGIGVVLYFGLMDGKTDYLENIEAPEESRYVIIGITGISLVFLVLVVPIWYIQVKNIIADARKVKVENQELVMNTFASVEESDTMSMLLKPSSEWLPSSYVNTGSLIRKHTEQVEKSCCYKNESKEISFK